MKINTDIKYTLDDLVCIPQYSEVESRSKVDTSASLFNYNGSIEYKFDLPIIASPMDSVVGSEMLARMAYHGCLAVLHRFRSLEWTQKEIEEARDKFINLLAETNCYSIPRSIFGGAIGVNGDYLERLQLLLNQDIKIICVDIAHGHHILMKKAVEEILKILPSDCHLMAGNVATYEGTQYLYDMGVDSVRSGIACFIPGTLINTEHGLKPIESIEIGTKVFSHTGNLREVKNKFEYFKNEDLFIINNIVSTGNHEYYVINVADQDKINEENIHEYAFWVSAEKLDKNLHLLIELEQ